ncbi:putative tetratricopeptide-like helical domain superfamily, DYW domain-containing protein [Dioscorea sansibarensis]
MAVILPAPAKPLVVREVAILSNPRKLLLEQCKTLRELRQIHGHLIKSGLLFHLPFLAENLLESSALLLPNNLAYALKVFDQIPAPRTQAYNILIRAFILHHAPENALLLFDRMITSSIPPDKFTFSCALKACSRLKSLAHGREIHSLILRSGFGFEDFVINSLIHMYATCGEVGTARALFDGMPVKGVVTWNAMFAGYFKAGDWTDVVSLFREMLDSSAEFDQVTLISVLTACGRLGELNLGEWIYHYIEENGLKGNLNLVTCLVDMYAKCGQIDKAHNLFDEMPFKDVVAWSAMISGYTQLNQCKEALELFHRMQIANVDPNEVTMVSVLSACAVLGALETGQWVHSYIRRKRMQLTVNLGTALMDFYAKCGCIENSVEVFEKMPVKNSWSWTVLIKGLASNGCGREALKFFSAMQEANEQPSDVTFVCVLSACSHAGLINEGQLFFDSMTQEYGIQPRIEHYGCMVDILGRSGLLEEAYDLIRRMPIEPNAVIWRTLLSSCKIHKNVEFAEESLKQLVKLDPGHSGDYILLSSIYASVGRWEDAVIVRNQMKEKGIKKTPGCSLIEMDGMIHEFFAEESAHPLSKEIYEKIEEMVSKIKLAGYVPNLAEARLDAEEDEKEVSVSHHSEKLAIAFGLIKSQPGSVIRVSKNLRVCTDCHLATKLISKVYQRDIVVRDRNRFHHFRDGDCSCNDYW